MRVEQHQLPQTKTPVLSYCRDLLENNLDLEEDTLQVLKDSILMFDVKSIRQAAKLTVLETRMWGPVFVKYENRYYTYPQKKELILDPPC